MAIGALPLDVVNLVLGQELRLALTGVAIGIAVALAVTRLIADLLFGVEPSDPITLACVSLLLTNCRAAGLRVARVSSHANYADGGVAVGVAGKGNPGTVSTILRSMNIDVAQDFCASSRRSHARASRSSCRIACAERLATSAISSAVMPPK